MFRMKSSRPEPAGIWPVWLAPDGKYAPLTPDGSPVVKELNATDLSIRQPLREGGTFTMVCSETTLTCTAVDGHGQPLHWAWELVGGAQQKSTVQTVTSNTIAYHFNGMNYQLRLAPDAGLCEQLSNGTIRLSPDHSGKLTLNLGGF